MSAWRFTQPGGLNDFSDPQKWHEAMAAEAKGIVDVLVETVLGRRPTDAAEHDRVAATLAYADPTRTPPPADAATFALTPWGAFPRLVTLRDWADVLPPDEDDPDGTYRASEETGVEDAEPGTLVDRNGRPLDLPVRHRQDEYLEWVVRKDAQGRITKAIFVAEGYDYFAELFLRDEARVVELYRDFTGVGTIEADDLRTVEGINLRRPNGRTSVIAPPGGFNPRNAFNRSPGIVHLSHRANSLGAEINLAGVSGIARRLGDGTLLDGIDERRLLCCADGGDPNRNSDPMIAKQAYAQVMTGKHYTLANPVGLYIADIAYRRLTLPGRRGPVPEAWWTIVRGSKADKRMLRVELEVPAGEGLVLGELFVDGLPLKYGAQLADLLTVHLFVTAWARAGGGTGPAVPCEATCCVKKGTDILDVTTDGKCADDYELKYPGLVVAGPRLAAGLTRTRPVTAHTRLR